MPATRELQKNGVVPLNLESTHTYNYILQGVLVDSEQFSN